MIDFSGVRVIKCRHSSKYSIIFNSGISVSVEQADDILEIMLQVPPIWKGMGHWFQSVLIDTQLQVPLFNSGYSIVTIRVIITGRCLCRIRYKCVQALKFIMS